MDRNFKVRVSVGIGMFAISLLGLYIFDGIPFKILFGIFSFVSAIELFSFFKLGASALRVILAILELTFLVCGVVFVARIDTAHFWYIILGVPGYDIFAYLSGKLLGGRIIKKSRPFPHISKNKTWEGTLLGLAMSMALVAILLVTCDAPFHDYIFLLSGPLALIGDLFESWLKRKFDIKDSNEIVIKNPVFKRIEYVVGGSNGHGGFLDRIDSVAVATTILYILMKWLVF